MRALVVTGLAVLALGVVTPAASAEPSGWAPQCGSVYKQMGWNIEQYGRHARAVDQRSREISGASGAQRESLQRSHAVQQRLRDRYAAWARYDAGRYNDGCGGIDIDDALAASHANRGFSIGAVYTAPVHLRR